MTNLFCLVAAIWVVTEKLKKTSKQKIISQISRSSDNILWTLILDWTIALPELVAFSPWE